MAFESRIIIGGEVQVGLATISRRAGVAVLLLLVVIASACRPPSEPRPAPRQVIFILLDAARLDRFGYMNYAHPTTPAMDDLAERGVVFRNHYAQATHTRASLPTLLYSRYFVPKMFPASSVIPLDSPDNLIHGFDEASISLPRALAEAGFETAAISAHSWIKPETRFGHEFDSLQDLSAESGRRIPVAQDVVDRALTWMGDHREDDFFLYLHMMDTHFPHALDADAQTFYGASEYRGVTVTGGVGDQDVSEALQGDDRRYMDAIYDGSLRYADRQIGRLVDAVRENGMLDETLFVITSDHGDHLLHTPRRFTHIGPWLEPLARIPWIVSYPKAFSEPVAVEAFSDSVDILPTILGLLELPHPAGKAFDGIDQSAVWKGEITGRERGISREGIRIGSFKLIIDDEAAALAGESAPSYDEISGALYDLASDPDELHDLWADRPELVEEIAGEYHAALREPWLRYKSAVSIEQPKVPFAISSRSFETPSEMIEVARDPSKERFDELVASGEWHLSRWTGPKWVLAGPGAEPMEISFPLPDGTYRVKVHAEGKGTIRFPQGHEAQIGGGAEDRQRVVGVDVGMVDVRDRRFMATLVPPEDEDWLRVTMLGFRAVRRELALKPEVDADRLEQLRILGYVD
jgi:arylsulfatase